ncbi:MAG: acyl-CoA thioesterase [Bacteroidota bacterium]
MIKDEIKVRVRYVETDRMGYVYYGNYATYFEIGRVELLRKLGFNYIDLEDSGIALPVAEMNIKYIKPAFYDQLLTVRTTITEAQGVRIKFSYETFNEAEELINSAETTLVFINTSTNKPCAVPEDLSTAIHSKE